MEQALIIADDTGLFDNDSSDELILRAHKQKIRSIFRNHKNKGIRIQRSVKTDNGNVFVNLFDMEATTDKDLDVITNDEYKRISKSVKVINEVKRIGQWRDGQITLDEVFTYDELYGSLQ